MGKITRKKRLRNGWKGDLSDWTFVKVGVRRGALLATFVIILMLYVLIVFCKESYSTWEKRSVRADQFNSLHAECRFAIRSWVADDYVLDQQCRIVLENKPLSLTEIMQVHHVLPWMIFDFCIVMMLTIFWSYTRYRDRTYFLVDFPDLAPWKYCLLLVTFICLPLYLWSYVAMWWWKVKAKRADKVASQRGGIALDAIYEDRNEAVRYVGGGQAIYTSFYECSVANLLPEKRIKYTGNEWYVSRQWSNIIHMDGVVSIAQVAGMPNKLEVCAKIRIKANQAGQQIMYDYGDYKITVSVDSYTCLRCRFKSYSGDGIKDPYLSLAGPMGMVVQLRPDLDAEVREHLNWCRFDEAIEMIIEWLRSSGKNVVERAPSYLYRVVAIE